MPYSSTYLKILQAVVQAYHKPIEIEVKISKADLLKDAEKIKLGGSELEDKDKPALEEIFTTMVSGWVQETSRALDFLSTTYPEEKIEKIFVSGGACKIPDFIKYLEMETGIPVEELNPFGGLQINEKIFDPKYLSNIAPQAGVAVGLALRSVGDK